MTGLCIHSHLVICASLEQSGLCTSARRVSTYTKSAIADSLRISLHPPCLIHLCGETFTEMLLSSHQNINPPNIRKCGKGTKPTIPLLPVKILGMAPLGTTAERKN